MTKNFILYRTKNLKNTYKATVPLSEFYLAPEPKVMKGLDNGHPKNYYSAQSIIYYF